jgi:hypothetical protein
LSNQNLGKQLYYPINVFLSNAFRLPAPKQQKMAAADAGQSDVEPKKRLATVEDDYLKQLLTEKDAGCYCPNIHIIYGDLSVPKKDM